MATSDEKAAATAARYGLDPVATARVMGDVAANRVVLLAMSGHLGSGKDTVAPLIMDRIGFTAPMRVHMSFADPLRAEIASIIAVIAASGTPERAQHAIAIDMGTDMIHAQGIVSILWDDVRAHPGIDGSSRLPSVRRALQYWGTDVRRAASPCYWVDAAMASAVAVLDSGRAVYLTDARFPNELDAIHALGGFAVRLLVSPEEQSRRIMGRDHVAVTADMRSHPSETAADGYVGFDAVEDTDGVLPGDLAARAIADIAASHPSA